MLFAVKYHPRDHLSEDEWRRARTTFLRWEPPDGVEIRHHFHLLNNDGVIIVESSSSEQLYRGIVPFGQLVKIDIDPVVNVYEALAISLEHDEALDGEGRE